MTKHLYKYYFTLVLIGLISSCSSGNTDEKSVMENVGPGPCYDQSLHVYLEDEFRVLPEFSSKGQDVLNDIEKETGLNSTFWIGHHDNDSTGMTCRTLDIVFETTNLNKSIQLDTSGRMEEIMSQVFDTYLSECTNTNAYEQVFLRFIVGKDETYEDFISEKTYYLSLYQKGVNKSY